MAHRPRRPGPVRAARPVRVAPRRRRAAHRPPGHRAGHRRRPPTATELAASIRTDSEADWAHQQLWQRFHDHRAAMFADDVQRLRAESDRLADLPPHRQPVASYDDRRQVVAGMAPLRVRTGETFPLLRYLVGDFRDRDPRVAGYGSYTVYANRLEVITSAGETIELTLQVMVRGGLPVDGPAVTPFCPAEADYTDDPNWHWPAPVTGGPSHCSARCSPRPPGHA